MKALVVFYSGTGSTKRAAQAIAKGLGADLEELVDKKNRSSPIGMILATRDALAKKPAELNPLRNRPESYGLAVVGTPIWAGTMAPAVRTFLLQNASKFKETAFFSVAGHSSGEKAFDEMAALAGKKPKAVLSLFTKETNGSALSSKAGAFAQSLKA